MFDVTRFPAILSGIKLHFKFCRYVICQSIGCYFKPSVDVYFICETVAGPVTAGATLYSGLEPVLPRRVRGGRADPLHTQHGLLYAGRPRPRRPHSEQEVSTISEGILEH